MKLHIIGSSSSGNAYALESENETLLLEAGVGFQKVKKALDFNLNKIVGCLVTHEHGDHAKYAKEVVAAGIDIHTSNGTIKAMKLDSHRLHITAHGKKYQVGEFKIMAFDVKHDASEPLGFLINHPEMGNCLFITDSYYVEYVFPGLNNILIEANYDENILIERVNSGRVHPIVANRVRSSHMELGTLKTMLQANDLHQVNNIVLIHLSDGNSDAVRFQKEISELTGKNITVADRDMTIQFNKQPF